VTWSAAAQQQRSTGPLPLFEGALTTLLLAAKATPRHVAALTSVDEVVNAKGSVPVMLYFAEVARRMCQRGVHSVPQASVMSKRTTLLISVTSACFMPQIII